MTWILFWLVVNNGEVIDSESERGPARGWRERVDCLRAGLAIEEAVAAEDEDATVRFWCQPSHIPKGWRHLLDDLGDL